MTSDYEAIRAENQKRYGTDVGRYGKSLLTDLYDDRTHFIYELLQNAEDALRRRGDAPQSRTVRFDLSDQGLRISHYGKPFDRRDVEGVCGIALSTKEGDLTRIGRFGIGFKSVYGFTDRPEVHSGDEDFGIDKFVWPSAQPSIERDPDQTIFVMPLRDPAENGAVIARGLRAINLDTLLFLREIDTIEWSIPTGDTGMYMRQSERLAEQVRRVNLIGESTGRDDSDQEWLVFSKPMHGEGGEQAGHVEVAFFIKNRHVSPVSRSSLVVFFPTAVPTNLGLRVQGPYRTTPSRENVPRDEPWNQACVDSTSDLLVDALLWLREHDMLNVDVLKCLPLEEAKFEDDLFAPLYDKIKAAFIDHRLLPVSGNGFAASGDVKIARSGNLRDLFTPAMLGEIFAADDPLYWLSGDITDRSAPELTRYLRDVLEVDEMRPLNVIRKLTSTLLERQSNEWVAALYEFLNTQRELHREARQWPIIRLSNGQHVVAYKGSVAQAYLPGEGKTNFPTIRPEVCSTDGAKEFLEAIGLSSPDPVEDVIRNILPKYKEDEIDVTDFDYAEDVERMVEAFRTDSAERREKLVQMLKLAHFVRAIDTEDRSCWSTPGDLYLRTDRLDTLFDGVEGIMFVDRNYECLRGGDVRSMLEACAASGYLQSEPTKCDLSWLEMREIRRKAGMDMYTRDVPRDCSLRGVPRLLAYMVGLSPEARRCRAETLWDALVDVAGRTPGAFSGTYKWGYYREERTAEFDAAIVRTLNGTAWVPSAGGDFRVPAEVSFETLGWRHNDFLLSKVLFKPPIVDQLAEAAGLEPAMLDKLKALGITSLADLEVLLPDQREDPDGVTSVDDAANALGVAVPSSSSVDDPHTELRYADDGSDATVRADSDGRFSSSAQRRESELTARFSQRQNPGPVPGAGRDRFVSYVAVGVNDEGDSDGLVHEERMALEEDAIKRILAIEQRWMRTPTNNEGFDLVEVADGRECAWCEVKAMKGNLDDRAVTMSHAQFKCAQERGDAYWLYIVERAGSDAARIVRIQDPAGKAKTFTFDKGWLQVAEVD